MKRYIEIVFDNSGSMGANMANGKSRLENAKTLFKEEIMPDLNFLEDVVAVRTLRNGCDGMSYAKKVHSQNELVQQVDSLIASGGTPLYNTVKDALNACKNQIGVDKIVFVLTDGDDTCGFSQNLNYTEEEMRLVKSLNVILLKYAIEDSKTDNNLEWFAGQIGAKTFSVGASGRTDFSLMRSDLRQGLSNTGFSNGVVSLNARNIPDYRLSWSDLKAKGIRFYQAELLYNERFLSWKPEANEFLDGKQWSELLFLWSLRFGNGLPVEIIRAMLAGLQKPYAFSQSGLYWDFEKTRWIVPEPRPTFRFENPNAMKQDRPNLRVDERLDNNQYDENAYYMVEEEAVANDIGYTMKYKLIDPNEHKEFLFAPDKKKVKKLRKGDIVQFVKPLSRGRKKKGG